MDTLLRDLKLGLRSLRQSPGFAATALLTIALGIGASTAIFSVVNAVLLRPLPYKNPEQLVVIWHELRARGLQHQGTPPGDFWEMRQRQTLMQDVAAFTTGRQAVSGDGRPPEQTRTAFVTTNFFSLLGARIVEGRNFVESDGTPNQPPPQQAAPPPAGAAGGPSAAPPPPPLPNMVILSHEFWQRHYGGDRSILDTMITLAPPPPGPPGPNNTAFTVRVVGILEPGFELLFHSGTNTEPRPDIYFASRQDLANATRTVISHRVIGRLKPGATVAALSQELEVFAGELRQRYPVKTTADIHFQVFPMHTDLVSETRPAILALMGAVTFVLLIACANVANLLLARATRRERELAVRAALGSSRLRLIRQMLAESLVVSSIGAALGLGLAQLGIKLLARIGPANLPRLDDVRIDLWVLGFAVLATLVSAILFGLLPALRASRPNVIEILGNAGRSANLAGRTLRHGVVVAEVTLSFVLLIGMGLMVRSFVELQRVNPGFDPRGVLTFFTPNVRATSFEAFKAATFEIQARLQRLPGVEVVTASSVTPFDGIVSNIPYGSEAAAADPRLMQQADLNAVLPGYFKAMGTRILDGREFTETDDNPQVNNVVIDSVLAARLYPGERAVGRRLIARLGTPQPTPWEIIGVTEQQKHVTLTEVGREQIFVSAHRSGGARRWSVRTSGDPATLERAVRAELARFDEFMAVTDVTTLEANLYKAQAPTRFALVLIGIFSVIAAVLASVGLYGVLATLVRQRTAEIGVRMAFGADRGTIFGLIVGHGLMLSAVGVVLGAIASFFLTNAMRSMVVGIRPNDPFTFVVIGVTFFVIALLACGIPAYRAARLDPTVALRST
jgi:putative ABC transport system permease protein